MGGRADLKVILYIYYCRTFTAHFKTEAEELSTKLNPNNKCFSLRLSF